MARDRQILQAAATLFYERGFDAVGVDEIGERAGVTGPAIYRHFASKDEILAVLFDEAIDGLPSVRGAAFEDPMEELRYRAKGHVEYVLGRRSLASVRTREERSLAAPFRRRLHRREREYIDGWIDCLRRCFPDRDEDELATVANAVLGMMNSVAHWPPDALRAAGLPDILTSLVMGGLRSLGVVPLRPADG